MRRSRRRSIPSADDGAVRIQKFLSRAGVASRRGAEELMVQGRVRVNGVVVTELGRRIRPGEDRIEVDGRRVVDVPFRWLMLHKTEAAVTTADDPEGRRTVYDDLPADAKGLAYVGRLDIATEGLLLFSNEGDAVHGLLHPSSEVEREYRVHVEGTPTDATLSRLRDGVRLEDGPARAVRAEVVGREGNGSVLGLVLLEGRNREVRRLCEAVGHRVRRLVRIRFGPVELGDLPPGAWRKLTDREVHAIRSRVGDPDPRDREGG